MKRSFNSKKNQSFNQRTPSVEYMSSASRSYAFSINGDFCMYVKVYVDYLYLNNGTYNCRTVTPFTLTLTLIAAFNVSMVWECRYSAVEPFAFSLHNIYIRYSIRWTDILWPIALFVKTFFYFFSFRFISVVVSRLMLCRLYSCIFWWTTCTRVLSALKTKFEDKIFRKREMKRKTMFSLYLKNWKLLFIITITSLT
jgi:hypothetical protein